MNANANDCSTATQSQAITRDLESNWARVVDAIGETDPDNLKLMQRVYWFGVSTGVQIFNEAITGKYGRQQQ